VLLQQEYFLLSICCSLKKYYVCLLPQVGIKIMNEPSTSRSDVWRRFVQRIRKGVKSTAPFAAGVLAALLALVLYTVLVPGIKPLTLREVNDSVAQALASATPRPAFSTGVYQAIQPSLVLIQVTEAHADKASDHGLGSGVVIDNKGDILTSLHVVKGATEIKVTFADGTESGAQVVSSQPENDIAVLLATNPPQQLFPAVLGNPGAMRVGDEAYVVGNPFGLYSSMSSGVVSGLDRVFQLPNSDIKLHNMIQIDAAVNPGNSGGPLLNRSGHVIGIITGIVNPTDQNFFVGIGFAVPINIAVGGVGGAPLY
jgi:S1-C subfamily serine protease